MHWWVSLLGMGFAIYAGIALLLYAFQDRQIYFPDMPSRHVDTTPAQAGLSYESVKLQTADGETLDSWFIPAPQARGTLLFLHGNAGNIGHRLDPIAVFQRMGLNVLIFDYRGYGASTGKPSEAGTYQDAQAAWEYLTQQRGVNPAHIVLFGESLGGSIAAWLAAKNTPAALIIFGSFTSVPDLAQQLFPVFPARLLARYRYDTREALKQLQVPVLIMHSLQDEIIPFHHGQELYAAAHEPKQLLELRGGHNDALLVSQDAYARAVDKFLAGRLPKR